MTVETEVKVVSLSTTETVSTSSVVIVVIVVTAHSESGDEERATLAALGEPAFHKSAVYVDCHPSAKGT